RMSGNGDYVHHTHLIRVSDTGRALPGLQSTSESPSAAMREDGPGSVHAQESGDSANSAGARHPEGEMRDISFHELLDHAPDGIIIVGGAGRIALVNAQA